MDFKVFWLIGLFSIGIIGALLIFVRRFRNEDPSAGWIVAGWTGFLLFLWVLCAMKLF